MSSDHSWMYARVDKKGYLRKEFIKGVEEFVDFAFLEESCVSRNKIKCPCSKCDNRKVQT